MDPRWTARVLVPVLSLGALTLTAYDAPEAEAATRCNGAGVVAHRGVHDARNTENTVRAARRAIEVRADAVESDLRLTRDGVWVLMHDRRVDRTTNGSGGIATKSWAQVRRLRTTDGVRGGVPSVEGFLRVLDSRPTMALQLEIKPSRVSARAMTRLFTIFGRHRLQQRLTVISFHESVLSTVRRRHPQWQTGLISGRQVPVAQARRLGSAVSIRHGALTQEYAASLRRAGLRISAWTINDTVRVDRAVAQGVQNIVTDQAALVRRHCG